MFLGGIFQLLNLCSNTTASISSLLTISDIDAGDMETWSIATAPAHGVATVAATAFANGVSNTPTGLTYTPTAGYSGSDVFQVRISDGLASQLVTISVNVAASPAAITGSTSVCIGAATSLSNSSVGGTWSSTSTILSIDPFSGVVTGALPGTATVTYTAPGGCSTAALLTVNNVPTPITGITGLCPASSIALGSTPAGGNWSIPGGSVFASVGPTSGILSGTSPGTLTVRYTLSTGCFASDVVTITAPPSAITGSIRGCIGMTTTLSDATLGGNWTSSNIAVADVDPSSGVVSGYTTGTATITYSLGTGCNATRLYSVNPVPGAITGIHDTCAWGSTLRVHNPNEPTGSWSSTLVTVSPSGLVTSFAPGLGTISYTILSTGCYASAPITINPLPVPITGIRNVCVGLTTTLIDSTIGGAWTSSNTTMATADLFFGGVTGVSSSHPIITYTLPTGCFATTTFTVKPLPAPITGVTNVCTGYATTLSDTTSIGTGVWSSDNTTIATAGLPFGTITGVTTGTTIITYAVATGCYRTTTLAVNQTPPPITGIAYVCTGQATTLSNSMTGGTWSGSAITATATVGSATGIVTGISAGLPVITYKIPVTGCITTQPVAVYRMPSLISGNTVLCAGSTRALTDSVSGGSWGSGNPAIATISTGPGIVSGLTAGTAAITYTTGVSCRAYTTVTVIAQPSLFLVTGGGSFCSTGTGVHVGLSFSTPGITYKLFNGTTLTGTLAGTGSPIDFGLEASAGTYTVIGINPITTCSVNMPSIAVVSIIGAVTPAVTIGASTGTTICAGTPVAFTATPANGGSFPIYNWKVNGTAVGGGSNSYAYTPANHDVVNVTLHTSDTCVTASTATYSVTMSVVDPVVPVVSITASPSNNILIGQTVTLSASVTNGGTAPTFQWQINGAPFPGATAPVFVHTGFNNNDSVSCQVIASDVCNSHGSAGATIKVRDNTGVRSLTNGEITVAPNPSKGTFIIDGTLGLTDKEETTVELTNVIGQVVYRTKITTQNGYLHEQINPGAISSGSYLLSIRSISGTKVFHLVIE